MTPPSSPPTSLYPDAVNELGKLKQVNQLSQLKQVGQVASQLPL
ncbi:hypothetical protein GCM10020221_09230 [Streptomyces thioluteus]|uniref:Uncharacterized protein n=1 Tax=Streptomyces thioluteus TaxID=66431 RepID=A0ABN3WIJ9_STRTU